MVGLFILVVCIVAVLFRPTVDCSCLYYSSETTLQSAKDTQEKVHVTSGGEEINQRKSTPKVSKPPESPEETEQVLADFDPNSFANDLFNDIKSGNL